MRPRDCGCVRRRAHRHTIAIRSRDDHQIHQAGAAEAGLEPVTPSTCPRCADARLSERYGVLHEDVCGRCRGRFLPPDAVERVFVDELGVSRDILRGLASHFASRERIACPSCQSKLSGLQLRTIRIHLCTGCGGAWLASGELRALSSGRYEELTPEAASASDDFRQSFGDAPASALPSSSASPGSFLPSASAAIADDDALPLQPRSAAGRGNVVVFFRDPEDVPLDALTAAFTKTKLFAMQDAVMIGRRKSTVAAESLDEEAAARLVAALAGEGIAAASADDSWTRLPPAIMSNAFEATPDALVLGRGDATSRLVAPWPTVAAIAAGIVTKYAMRSFTTTKQRAHREEHEHEHELVTSDDASVDVILSNPSRRFRLGLGTMIFGADVAGRSRPSLFIDRLSGVVAHAPVDTALGSGVKRAASGEKLPKYLSMRDLERELCWLLWTRYGS